MPSMRAAVDAALHLGRRSLDRFVELEGFDRAMALAGQMFAALLPLLIVVGSVTPGGGKDVADGLTRRLHLSGGAAATLHDAVAQPSSVRSSVTVVGVFLLVVSALSFTRALQRLYLRAWRLPSLGVVGNGWGLIWLVAYSVYWTLQPVVIGLFGGFLEDVVTVTLSFALWVFTPWILVGRRIPWRRLAPQAGLTAFGLAAVAVGALVYGPRAITSAAAQFGFIGLAFTLLSMLFVASLVLVVTAAVGATLAEPSARLDEVERRVATV
jgi:membrane protein